MKKALLTIVLSAAAVAVGCRSTSKDAPITELPANSLRTEWTRTLEMKGTRPDRMYVNGDNLFVYRSDNLLYRIDRKSGDVVAVSNVVPKGARATAPVVLKDGLVVPADTKLYILDGRGFQKNTIDLKSPIRTGVVGNDDGLFFGIDSGQGGRVACIDLDKPASPFRWQLRGRIVSTPVLYKGVLYAGTDEGKVYAVDADMTNAWPNGPFQTNGRIVGDLSADQVGVYVASSDTKLYCLSPADGRIRWQYFSGAPLFDSPAVTATSVYINVRDKGLVRLDKKEGDYNRRPKWIVKDATQFLAEDEKLAYLRGTADTILAVDKQTGEVKAQSHRGDLCAFAVNTVDGLVYAAAKGGKVFAATAVTKPGAVGELVFLSPEEAQQMLASR